MQLFSCRSLKKDFIISSLYHIKNWYGFEWKLCKMPKCSQKWQIFHASTEAFDLGRTTIFALSLLERVKFLRGTQEVLSNQVKWIFVRVTLKICSMIFANSKNSLNTQRNEAFINCVSIWTKNVLFSFWKYI